MKTIRLLVLFTGVMLFAGCSATIPPKELVNARETYQRANTGIAAQVAPSELHQASQALAKAEESFLKNPDSYQTRDLAYVAQRKSELAEATASITNEQKSRTQAGKDYQSTQGRIVTETKQDLNQTRMDLATAEQSGKMTAEQLAVEQKARTDVEQRAAEAKTASDLSSKMTAEQLAVEQKARSDADRRTAEAQAALLANLADVKEDPRGIVITLSGSVLFASNKTALLPNARLRLDQVADVLLTTRERKLTVEGHTDSQGSNSYNLSLSQSRADEVRNYLVQRGYQADHIQANGLGEGHPIADNANAEGRANNRRVEIVIEREAYTSLR